jgi:hypothetical protein
MIVNDVAWLSLAVIMVHEFEEIAFIEPFLARTRHDPRAPGMPFHSTRGVATSVTALLIGVNFVLFTGFTLVAVLFGWYSFLWGFLVSFTMHLAAHCAEPIRLRTYTPSTVTAYLTLPWMLYALWYLPAYGHVRPVSGAVAVVVMMVLAPIDLGLLHANERRLDAWLRRTFDFHV